MEYSESRHIGDILKARERDIEIVGADLATRHGFTQVPNFILTNANISVGAKLAYAMLLKYAWQDEQLARNGLLAAAVQRCELRCVCKTQPSEVRKDFKVAGPNMQFAGLIGLPTKNSIRLVGGAIRRWARMD